MRKVSARRTIENALRRYGFVCVAGVDEVGRGCLAGPVMAGAVILDPDRRLDGLADSKALTAAQRERCLDFVDSLWSAEGGFHGHWADDHLDAEYTFYGLLALGHLSVQ